MNIVPTGLTSLKFLQTADEALYAAKNSGRNCVRMQFMDAPRRVQAPSDPSTHEADHSENSRP